MYIFLPLKSIDDGLECLGLTVKKPLAPICMTVKISSRAIKLNEE